MFRSWSNGSVGRRALSLATAAGLTLLVSPAMAALTALPAHASIGGFNAADANKTCENSEQDWNCVTGVNTQSDLSNTDSDNTYIGGVKEDTENPGTQLKAPNPEKGDLTQFQEWSQIKNNDLFLYLNWSLYENCGGDVHVDFEINQSKDTYADGLPKRTDGDVIISYDFNQTNAGSSLVISDRVWNDTTKTWGSENVLSAGTYEASIDSTDCQFGEVGINLGPKADGGIGLFDPSKCTSFATAYAKTRNAGSGFDAQLNDFISPVPVDISNCGTIITKKVTDPSGASQKFTFNVSGSVPDHTLSDGPFQLADGGSHTTSDVWPSDGTYKYTIAETAQSGWTNYDASCDNASGSFSGGSITGITVAADETVTCTFYNREQAKLIVKKVTDPSNTGDTFSFTGSSGVGTITDLGDGDTWTSGYLDPGTYTVQEATKTGWDLTGLSCDDSDSTGSVSTRTATYKLAAGETVTCTFTNTERGSITVKKVTDPPGGKGFVFTGDASGTIDDGGTITVDNLQPGTYHSTEQDASGYSLAQIACDDGASAHPSTGDVATRTATFNVDPGEHVTCTFSNSELAQIIIKKVTVPSGSAQEFPFTLTGGTSNLDQSFSLKDQQTHASGLILAGSGYDAAETLPDGWEQTGATCDNGSPVDDITVANGETVTCTFTNTHHVSLTITKAITANGDTVPAGGFVFDVSCSDGTTGTLTFTSAGSQSVGGIVEGSTCDVTETPVDGWTSSPSGTQQVTVGPDGATVSFTNTRDTGVITVTKATSGAVAGASTVFTFDITCPDHPEFDQTVTLDTSKESSATSGEIPTGFACTVTEEPTAGWQQTDPANGAGVDVTVPGTAAFTNTRLTGPLQLVKSVSPSTGSYTAGDPNNTLTYTLTLSPTGDLDHTDVVVTDYIPGWDPADTTSGKTTYVIGSATCSTGCAPQYDDANHLLTWPVGDVAHDAAPVVMTFQVTIDRPTPAADGSIPAETIDNVGFVQSLQQAKTPSNQVQTPVTAVLGEKVKRQLPFTGLALPLPATLAVALTLIGAGLLLTATRRRREEV